MAKGKVQQPQEPAPGSVLPPAPARGVYAVRVAPYPRRTIDTGLSAGPEAEAVARARYKASLGIMRQDLVPEVEAA